MKLQLRDYEPGARRVVLAAQSLSDGRGHAQVQPIHLLHSLAHGSGSFRAAVQRCGTPADDLLLESELCLRRQIPRSESEEVAYLSEDLVALLKRAEAQVLSGQPVGERDLAMALLQSAPGDVQLALAMCQLEPEPMRATWAQPKEVQVASGLPALPGCSDLTAEAEKGWLDPVVGRAREVRRILQVLARRNAHNPLLIGEPGVGKRSLVRALALRIAERDVPEFLAGVRIYQLRLSLLQRGVTSRSDAEGRFRDFLGALTDRPERALVHVLDLPHMITGREYAGMAEPFFAALRDHRLQVIASVEVAMGRALLSAPDRGPMFSGVDIEPPTEPEAVAMLRGVVASYERAHGVRIVDPALTSAVALAKRYLPGAHLPASAIDLIDEAAARVVVSMQGVAPDLDHLRRAVQSIDVQLASLRDDHDAASLQAVEELSQVRAGLLRQEQALVPVEPTSPPEPTDVAWSGQHGQLAGLGTEPADGGASDGPSQSANALEPGVPEGAVGAIESPDVAGGVAEVTDVHVAEVISERTGVPVTRMLEDEADKLRQMEARIAARVIGQRAAVAAVSRAVTRSRTGLRDGTRPIGSFLFLGTSGVGKTELAKAVAAFLFDDEVALTRLDMSEFMEKHTVARLLGSPPGYADSEDGGFLTEAVRRRPYSVILLDEVEKAHPDVFNIMLQVLDDGRLTDARGRLAHFTDTVIIMTSNLGSHHMLEPDLSKADRRSRVLDSLHGHFRPEFLNRIDDIVLFETLDRAALTQILDIHLAKLGRLLTARRWSLQVSDGARRHLVALADQPAFGARPLRRVLQREVADPVAAKLLGGARGPGTVRVDCSDRKICIELNGAEGAPRS